MAARDGLRWEAWETAVVNDCRTVDEACAKLMRSPRDVRRRLNAAPPRRCYHCNHWERGICGIEEAGLHLAGEPVSGLRRWEIVHECHLGLV